MNNNTVYFTGAFPNPDLVYGGEPHGGERYQRRIKIFWKCPKGTGNLEINISNLTSEVLWTPGSPE